MKIYLTFFILFLVLTICLLPVKSVFAGIANQAVITIPQTDNNFTQFNSTFYIFDLRDRETFIQLTLPDASFILPQEGINGGVAHLQIFDVSSNCNENDFFDTYTLNDTHTYNMRNIKTNDGNPAGVILPDGAYGIVAVTMIFTGTGFIIDIPTPFGSLRIIDKNGYEYRTNAQAFFDSEIIDQSNNDEVFYSYNFNQQGNVSLSDVFGITLYIVDSLVFEFEWSPLPVQGIFSPFDVDIYDLNETPFSCRDIIFSCVDENNPILEELLSIAGTANVASFEYGINNAIPHSKGGNLLCPGNTISEGTAILRPENYPDTVAFNDIIDQINGVGPIFFGFIGLNNGNGRGSMDSFWVTTRE